MSSDEDFSLVLENRQPMETLEGQQPMETLEGIQKSISNYKLQYEHLLQEQKELSDSRDDQKDMAEKFRQRSQKLMESLEEDQHAHTKDLDFQKEKLHNLQREENELKSELKVSEAALDETEANNVRLKQQTDLSKADVPEKKVVFSGATGDATTSAQTFDMKAHIVYPMEGGTALITFEDEIVAQKILDMKNHKVGLGDECAITLEAKPIQLMMPRIVEMDTQVCPRRILVSNLPKKDCDILLDKLEIYFAKSRNGGGEVEDCDMLHDSGNVVITFVETNIAKYLADKHYHEVEFEKGKKQRVKVTPFLNGEITKLKNEQAVCARTVLLTGIPAIMEQDNLQDLLEIHFQQASNGGGEVDAFLYNPLGQRTLALFDDEDGLNV